LSDHEASLKGWAECSECSKRFCHKCAKGVYSWGIYSLGSTGKKIQRITTSAGNVNVCNVPCFAVVKLRDEKTWSYKTSGGGQAQEGKTLKQIRRNHRISGSVKITSLWHPSFGEHEDDENWITGDKLTKILDAKRSRRRLTNQALIDRFIRESLRCQTS